MEVGWHLEEGKHIVKKIAEFVGYGGMDTTNGQVH